MRLDRHLEMITPAGKGRGVIHLVLSRRNLLALLHKIDLRESEQTIIKDFPSARVIVTSEDDDAHYADSSPGPMSPETEQWLADVARESAGESAGPPHVD